MKSVCVGGRGGAWTSKPSLQYLVVFSFMSFRKKNFFYLVSNKYIFISEFERRKTFEPNLILGLVLYNS